MSVLGSVLFLIALLGGGTAFAVGLSRMARGRRAEERAAAAVRREEALAGLVRTALPVWERQLETARSEASQAGAALVAQFEAIVARLEGALGRSRAAAASMQEARAIVGAVTESKRQLAALVQSLDDLRRSKEQVLRRLDGHALEVGDMASQVKQVAMQITLLSLNATIEAARAGDAGRPFAVLVQEMRQLASRAGETAARMTRGMESIASSLADVKREAQSEQTERAQSMREAEDAVGRLIDTSALLAERLGAQVVEMQGETDAVREKIAEAMVALQFEDRVNQIVAHVAGDVRRLDAACASNGALDGRTASWRTEMAGAYSMAEEFDNLEGARPARRAAGGVTYFS